MSSPPSRARREPFGAWIRLGDDTLVALDHRRADRLGLPPATFPPGHVSAPLEVHVAVTARCPVDCSGCYQSATTDGAHVPLTQLRKTLRDLHASGVFTVAFGGGEPLLRDDLGELADEARSLGLTPVVTTSGYGLTPARARALRSFAQVNVSHDGVLGGYEAVRGFDGVAVAERAIATLRAHGVAVGVNHVLTRQNVDGLPATVDHVRSLGARELQLLRYKPAGRAASLDYLARRLTPAQCDALGETLRSLSPTLGEGFSVRVDCALVPLVSGALPDAAMLERFGVFGCEAGGHLGSVRRDGSAGGCSFDDAPGDEGIAAFRAFVAAPPEPCASCSLRRVCRGGCKVVSRHLGHGFSSDPECPRVIAFHAGSASP
ncbi:MAG: radical SAM protein [Myxococcaceae bacterium]|nr:MAG: radical SAM protein [Myxococcaceae bacterium]